MAKEAEKNPTNSQSAGVNAARELIETGADITGAVAGAAIGLVGGPAGALVGAGIGAVAARVLANVGSEIQRRVLGPREHARMGAVAGYAVMKTKALLDQGAQLRDDGFFESEKPKKRSPADQVFEGVLLKARDAYEEKKLPYLGNLYAAIGFRSDVSPEYANYLVTLAGELTYNQYVILCIAAANPQSQLLRERDFRGDEQARANLDNNAVGLITEAFNLYQRGLIHGSDGSAWLSLTDVPFGAIRPQGAGAMLYSLMALSSIPESDKQIFYTTFPPSK